MLYSIIVDHNQVAVASCIRCKTHDRAADVSVTCRNAHSRSQRMEPPTPRRIYEIYTQRRPKKGSQAAAKLATPSFWDSTL